MSVSMIRPVISSVTGAGRANSVTSSAIGVTQMVPSQ